MFSKVLNIFFYFHWNPCFKLPTWCFDLNFLHGKNVAAWETILLWCILPLSCQRASSSSFSSTMRKHFWWNFSCIWANSWERFVSKDPVYFAGKWPSQKCFYGRSGSVEVSLHGCMCRGDLESCSFFCRSVGQPKGGEEKGPSLWWPGSWSQLRVQGQWCWGLFLEPARSAVLDTWSLSSFLDISVLASFFFLFLPIAIVYNFL